MISHLLRQRVTVFKSLAAVAGAMESRSLEVWAYAAITFCLDSHIILSNIKLHPHPVKLRSVTGVTDHELLTQRVTLRR